MGQTTTAAKSGTNHHTDVRLPVPSAGEPSKRKDRLGPDGRPIEVGGVQGPESVDRRSSQVELSRF